MRRGELVAAAALAAIAVVGSRGVWNWSQGTKTSSCLAATARALHHDGAALGRVRNGSEAREWVSLDRAQTIGALATVRSWIGDCSGWAADGALLDAWGQPVLIEIGAPASSRLPFRLRSAGADGSPHTSDDVTYEAFSSPAPRRE